MTLLDFPTTKNNCHQTKGKRKRQIDSDEMESSEEDEAASKELQLELDKDDDFDLSFNSYNSGMYILISILYRSKTLFSPLLTFYIPFVCLFPSFLPFLPVCFLSLSSPYKGLKIH